MPSYTPIPLAFATVNPEGGASEKPPVIFLHGLTASKEYWNDIPQTVANATKRTVYMIDARNHGDSPWSDVFNFDCNVDDFLHFMDTMKITKAILLGHSMGGITSIKTALKAPDRVEKLVVEDMNVQKIPQEIFKMSPLFFHLAKTSLQRIPTGADEQTAKKIIVSFIIENLPDEVKPLVNPQSLEQNIPMQLKCKDDGSYTYKANLYVLEQSLKNPSELMSEHEGVYEGPALFIYGKLSPFKVDSDEPSIRRHFPMAELKGFEKASHSVHSDYPHEFREAVVDFLLQ